MAHEHLSDTNRLVIEQRMGYCWVIMPSSIAAQDYASIEDTIVKRLAGKEDRMVIDFSNVRSLYSSGLGILVRLQKKIAQGGGVLALVNVSQKISDLLISLNLDRIFPFYSTDIEFEISQEELWKRKSLEQSVNFLFIAQVEKNLYRLGISGEMVQGRDCTACRNFLPNPKIDHYLLDLGGLSAMDSFGAGLFMQLISRVVQQGGKIRAYGAVTQVRQVLQFLGADQYIAFFDTESEALAGLFAA